MILDIDSGLALEVALETEADADFWAEAVPPVPRYTTEDEVVAARVRARDAFENIEFLYDCGIKIRKPAKPLPPPKPPKPLPPPKPVKIPKATPEPKPPPEFSEEEKSEALSIFLEQPDAPPTPTTSGAAKALEKLLKKFDYNLTNSTNKMRQYVLFKLFELAENDDPKLSIKAVEMLGKVSEIGLFSTKIEVSTNDKPTADLESELNKLLTTYSLGEIGVLEGSYKELTDAELVGEE